jgi:peptidoglycan hydrolase-like protein with peptidoglycan-binding domain
MLVIGMILIGAALVCNPWVLAIALSPDGMLEVETKVVIWFFEMMLVLVGAFLLNYQKLVNLTRITRHLIHLYPRLLALSFGIVFSILFLLFLEGFFYELNTYKRSLVQNKTDWSARFFEDDAWLGYKSLPNTQVVSRKTRNGQAVYEAVYTTDEYGRRITPIEYPGQRTELLLFFGDSLMFGQGVNGHETLPFYVAQLASRYRPYNYGVVGYGPQSMLATLQRANMAREIQEPQGILVYLFIDGHFYRAIGSMHVHSAWGHHLPFYTVEAQNLLVRNGDFTSGRPLRALFYRVLGASQIATYFGIDLPGRLTDTHITLTARIIEEARDVFRHKFQSDRFYVLLYPGANNARRMIPAFVRAGISYLDYSALFDANQQEFHIVGDGHPTPQAYRTVAIRLAHDLGIVEDQAQP